MVGSWRCSLESRDNLDAQRGGGNGAARATQPQHSGIGRYGPDVTIDIVLGSVARWRALKRIANADCLPRIDWGCPTSTPPKAQEHFGTATYLNGLPSLSRNRVLGVAVVAKVSISEKDGRAGQCRALSTPAAREPG